MDLQYFNLVIIFGSNCSAQCLWRPLFLWKSTRRTHRKRSKFIVSYSPSAAFPPSLSWQFSCTSPSHSACLSVFPWSVHRFIDSLLCSDFQCAFQAREISRSSEKLLKILLLSTQRWTNKYSLSLLLQIKSTFILLPSPFDFGCYVPFPLLNIILLFVQISHVSEPILWVKCSTADHPALWKQRLSHWSCVF